MNRADFIALKDFILVNNPYFQYGFDNSFKNPKGGGVYAKNGDDFVCVMPNDTLGNYFYLKNNTVINHVFNEGLTLSDCVGSTTGFNDIITIDLVAILKDADEYLLINALRNTVLKYTPFRVTPTKSNFNREFIVMDELSGLEKAEIQAALQRLKNETIIKISMNVLMHFISNTCINNPCKIC